MGGYVNKAPKFPTGLRGDKGILAQGVKGGLPKIQKNVNLSDAFKAVQNELRREILKKICDSGNEGVTFSTIWNGYKDVKDSRTKDAKYTKSNVSKHIRELGLSELIIVRQEKTNRRYFADREQLQVFRDFINYLGLDGNG